MLSYLLNPFWNHWLSLQSDWLSVVWFIQESHHFCPKSLTLFLSQWEWDSKTREPIRFQGSFKVINKISGKWKAKSHCVENFATAIAKLCCCLSPKIVRFQNGSNKVAVEPRRAILVWNHTCDFKSNSRYALVRFSNHVYDFRPNCTPLSSITIINLTLKYDIWMPPLLKLVNLIVITPCEFIELSQENYHLMLKPCF